MQGKSVIVYYSWLGNTEVVAKEIQGITKFDIQKIEEQKHRKLGSIMGAAMSAVLGLNRKIKPMDFSLLSYDTIFLGLQVWATKTAPAINKYLSKVSFEGKKVWLFITKGDEKEPQQFIDALSQRIEKKGGTLMGHLCITSKWDPETNHIISASDVHETISAWLTTNAILEA